MRARGDKMHVSNLLRGVICRVVVDFSFQETSLESGRNATKHATICFVYDVYPIHSTRVCHTVRIALQLSHTGLPVSPKD